MTQILILPQNPESIVAIAEVIIALITGGILLFPVLRFLGMKEGDIITN